MSFYPQCMATAIGSLPHENPSEACDVILKSIPEIPIWPQLPKTNFRENMEIQYSEGLPCVVFEEEKKRMFFDTRGDITNELEKFYENYIEENLDYFKISHEFSRGIYEMEKKLAEENRPSPKYFKSQVTGPITIGLGRVDENKRAIYYNEMFRDVVVKGTEMKARWLLRKFKSLGCDQICFIDEPILSAFGSSTYVSVNRSDVVNQLKDVIEAIHKEDSLAGTHCCGNTEWTILERGGVLAWGIVPTSEKINQETPESLVKKLEKVIESLTNKGIDKNLIWERCLLTPSCGTGSLAVELSEKIFYQLLELSKLLRH